MAALESFRSQDEEPLDERLEGSDPDEAQESPKLDIRKFIGMDNISPELDDIDLIAIGQLVVNEYKIDETSRGEWKDKTKQALEFAGQKTQPKVFPWENAANILFPLITTASIQFAARAYPAIVQNMNVVKGVVVGSDKGTPVMRGGEVVPDPQDPQNPLWIDPPGSKRIRADKIGDHMSWQLLSEMPEWEPETDTLLHQLPIVGGAIRKTYWDPGLNRNNSVLVPLLNLVWNRQAKSFESAPRHTEELEFYPYEIEQFERSGLWETITYGATDADKADQSDSEAPQVFLEQHRRLDLDDDGYPEPYIVTVHRPSAKVVRIVARFDEEGIREGKDGELLRIDPINYYTLYPFLPDPEGGSYPVGFGQLLRPLNEAINTTINQMLDAGTLQNTGGGFIGSSLSMHTGSVKFQVGEYKPVNNKGVAIRDAIYTMQWPGPSTVLFQLLGLLIEAGNQVAAVKDVLTGETQANQQATVTLAMIEQGLKVFTSIHKRIYRALKSELNKLYDLNRKHLTEDAEYRKGDTWHYVNADDYRLGGGVEPVADPTMVTDMQRLGRAQVLMGFNNDPLMNQVEIRRRFLDAAQIERPEDIIVDTPPPPNPELQARLQLFASQAANQQAQAFLNITKAKQAVTDGNLSAYETFLEAAMRHMELTVEAANTAVRAADVDVKAHKAHVDGKSKEATNAARDARAATQTPALVQSQATGMGGMAAPSDNGSLSPISG